MDGVSLTVPARVEFLHVVRAVTSGVSARQGLSYDAINDLCLATSEAAAYLLGLGAAGRRLSVRFRLEASVEVTVRIDAPVPAWPPQPDRTLAWRVLSGLVDEVALTLEQRCPAIRLVMAPPAAATRSTREAGRSTE